MQLFGVERVEQIGPSARVSYMALTAGVLLADLSAQPGRLQLATLAFCQTEPKADDESALPENMQLLITQETFETLQDEHDRFTSLQQKTYRDASRRASGSWPSEQTDHATANAHQEHATSVSPEVHKFHLLRPSLPTRVFDRLDANEDGKIELSEWLNVYGGEHAEYSQRYSSQAA